MKRLIPLLVPVLFLPENVHFKMCNYDKSFLQKPFSSALILAGHVLALSEDSISHPAVQPGGAMSAVFHASLT